VLESESGAPVVAPTLDIGVVVGPSEVLSQFFGDGVEVQRGVTVVPAEYLECRQIVFGLRLREMGEADLALIALAIVGDKEQVVYGPSGTLAAIG
jgi:hypothetical protein